MCTLLQITAMGVKGYQNEILPFDMLSQLAQPNLIYNFNDKQEIFNIPEEEYQHPLSFAIVKQRNITLCEIISNTLYQPIAYN